MKTRKEAGPGGANISYKYRVEKITYTSSHVTLACRNYYSGYAQEFVDRYPAGGKVTVYYEPSHPELAVLESGIHGGTWVALVVGIVLRIADGRPVYATQGGQG